MIVYRQDEELFRKLGFLRQDDAHWYAGDISLFRVSLTAWEVSCLCGSSIIYTFTLPRNAPMGTILEAILKAKQ